MPYTTGQWSLNAAEVCGLQTRPFADGRSAVIVGSADRQQTDFFIQRSRCCDHNEYSVKILHAVPLAITAIAELLVSVCPIISGMGKATNLKFRRYVHTVHPIPKKTELKM